MLSSGCEEGDGVKRDVEMRDADDIFNMWEKSSTNNASGGSGGSSSGSSSKGAGSGAIFDPADDIFAFMKMSGPVVSSSSSSNNVTGASGSSNIIGSLAIPLRTSSSNQPYPSSMSTSNSSTSADNFSEALVESVVEELLQILPDCPVQTIRRAVKQTNGGGLEQALQLILDGNVMNEEDIIASSAPQTNVNSNIDHSNGFYYGELSHSPPKQEKNKGKGKSRETGLSESQELMLMLQQEEAMRDIQRKRDEEASMALIQQLHREQELAMQERQKKLADDEELSRIIAEENDKALQRRRADEEVAQKLLDEMLEQERADRQAQLDAKTYTCSICYTDVKIEDMYTMEECDHRFCFDCMENFLSTQIKDGNTSHINCPTPKCTHKVTYDEVKQVVADDVFAKYEGFLLRNYLSTDANCRWCPRPGCGEAMIGSADNPMTVCPNKSCNFAFCFNCREEWHHDASCDEYQQWKALVESRGDEEPEVPVAAPAKPPPLPPQSPAKLSQREKRALRRWWDQMTVSPAKKPAAVPASPPPTNGKPAPPKPKPVVDWQKAMAEKPADLTFREWIMSEISDQKSGSKQVKDWIKQNTKNCPQCKVAIEKNGGCNHMTCHMCKHQFCWLCGEVYKSTHWAESKCKQYS